MKEYNGNSMKTAFERYELEKIPLLENDQS